MDCVVALPEEGPLVQALAAEGAETLIIPMFVLRKALLRPQNWPALVASVMKGWLSTWKLITQTKPECIYVSTVTLPQWPLIGRLRGIPCVTHVHEAEGSASRWVNLMIYLPHLASTSVLVNSQFSLRTIGKSLPKLAARAQVLANGVAGPPRMPSAPRKNLDGVLRVLYLGRLSPRKGPDLIIRAAQLLRRCGVDVDMVLAGSTFSGYEWYESELRDSLRAAGLEEDKVLVGFRDSIWPLLEDCDVLVVPSRLDEPFGNTAVEGVLAHRPIVVSDTTGLQEAAEGYPTAQFIERNDPEALAAALQELFNEWGAIRDKVEISAQMAQDRHDPATYRKHISESVARHL